MSRYASVAAAPGKLRDSAISSFSSWRDGLQAAAQQKIDQTKADIEAAPGRLQANIEQRIEQAKADAQDAALQTLDDIKAAPGRAVLSAKESIEQSTSSVQDNVADMKARRDQLKQSLRK